MAHQTVTFSGGLAYAGSQAVYIKARWADEWLLDTTLYATQVVWSAQPTIPVASLYRAYGPCKERGSNTPSVRTRLDIGGWFVKIVITMADGTKEWYGYTEIYPEETGGFVKVGEDYVETGTQTFQCTGIIGVLMHALVTKTPFMFRLQMEEGEESTFISDPEAAIIKLGERGPIFNEVHEDWPIPSRSVHKYSKEEGGKESYVFEPVGLYGNTPFPTSLKPWSTKEIVEHLVAWHPPVNAAGVVKVPYEWTSLDILPEDDTPTIETDRRSLLDLYNQLCSGRVMLGYYATVRPPTEDEETEVIVLHPYTMLTADVTVGDKTVAKNPNTLDINYFEDSATKAMVTPDLSQRANQVVCRGAKKIVVCTVPFNKNTFDFHPIVFDEAWDELTPEPDPTNDPYENANNRLEWLSHPKNRFYLRGYKFQNYWDWQLKLQQPIFSSMVTVPPEEEGGEPTEEEKLYFPSPYQLRLLDKLPFREGQEYKEATKDFDALATGRFIEPIVFGYRLYYDDNVLKVKNENGEEEFMLFKDRNRHDLMVGLDQVPYDIDLHTLDKERTFGVMLNVGSHPETLANTSNSDIALAPRDESPHIPRYSRSDLFATVAFEEDRSLEVTYPENGSFPDLDAVRTRTLEFGQYYQHVKILKGTCVGIGTDHKQETVEDDVYLRDGTDKLKLLAEQAYRFYSQDRRVMQLVSSRATTKIDIGKMVLKLNPVEPSLEKPVNTVVTQIAMDFQAGQSGGPCGYQVTTASGELDFMHFVPNRGQ